MRLDPFRNENQRPHVISMKKKEKKLFELVYSQILVNGQTP